MHMPHLLSIDPATSAKKQAYAILETEGDRPLLEYGRCTPGELADIIARPDIAIVVCEDQYVGKRTYWASMLKLAHYAGRIWEMAESRGKPFRWAPPSAWQGLIRGPGCRKREDLIERAVRFALIQIRVAGLPVPEKLHPDEAQAICMGVWVSSAIRSR